MNFGLSKEHQMIRDEVRRFAREVVAPRALEMDRTGEFPIEIIEQMGALGLIGIPYPEEYGGSGGDWVGTHICIEELSRADITVATIQDGTTSLCGQELFTFGTEEQKQKWLKPLLEGKCTTGFALTESDSGSDSGALQTTAVLDGDEYVINGTKQFITNIALKNASICIVAAVSGQNQKGKNIISTFIVPTDNPGMILGKKYKKIKPCVR